MAPGEDDWTCVVKAISSNGLKTKLLRYKRYAPAEAELMHIGYERGLPLPALHALGLRRRGPLVFQTVLLIEDLRSYDNIAKRIEDGEMDDLDAPLWTALTELVLLLYRNGCNHIDLSANNVMSSQSDHCALRLIDLADAKFWPEPSDRILAFHAFRLNANFQTYGMSADLCKSWIELLFHHADVTGDPDDLWSYYHSYDNGRRLRKTERRAIH
jgi:tRNA A-37 threonylcarbamoyl transferase component Bud32